MITIKPLNNSHIEINAGDQEVVIPVGDGPSMIAALKGQDTIRVMLKGNGFRLDRSTEQAALDAAGLDSFAAAKQAAQGYIEIVA